MSWLRRNNFPVICCCCGKLVTQCWERGHDKACDECRGHFWKNGPKGDKPCNGKALAAALRHKDGQPWPHDVARELRERGLMPTKGETVED